MTGFCFYTVIILMMGILYRVDVGILMWVEIDTVSNAKKMKKFFYSDGEKTLSPCVNLCEKNFPKPAKIWKLITQ